MRSPVLSSRQFEWTLAAFIATLAGHLLWLPPWYAAMLGGVLIARWLQRRAYARAWPAWIKFPLLLVVMIMALQRYGDPTGRHAAAAALLGLSVLKLIESERRRDALWLLPVALFLVSAQFLFTQGIGITLYMIIPTLLIFLALNEVCAPPGTRGGMTTQLGSLGREFVLMLAVVLPLTVFLFLSLPRLSEPLWGAREKLAQEGRTGLSGEMSPGTLTELLGDDTPVMRVTFPGATPAKSSMYWRGPVLWSFDGVTWRASSLSNPGQRDGRVDGPQNGAPGDLRYRVMLEPTDRNWLYTLDLASGFPAGSRRTVEGNVVRNRAVTELYPFEATAALDRPIPVWAFPTTQRNDGLRLPPGLNPRTAELAQSWRAEIGKDPMALAQRALDHIRKENFGYTLSPPPLVGANRMDEFLFETRLGFCEHYAAAFVVLMRNAGVPARVVTGYLGGDYNRIGQYWLVRNSDAHAWAEILVPDRGWVRVDPTAAIAPERIDLSGREFAGQGLGGDSEWLRSMRERFDALQAWWNTAMVRFDSQRQQSFFADLGINPSDWRHAAAWMGGGLTLFGVLTALIFALQRPRNPSDQAKRLYRRFLKALRKLGVVAGTNEGATDLGNRAAAALPALAKPIFSVVEAYEQARYAPPSADALGRLQRALAAFHAALRA